MPSARRGDGLVVRCAGKSFRLREASALEWVNGAVSVDMHGLFPGLCRASDGEALLDLWGSVPDMRRRCVNVARSGLGRVSGREWFWSYNLIRKSVGSWPYINGMLVRQGVHADRESLPDWLDASFTLWRELLNDEGRKALELELSKIPRGLGVPVRPAMSTKADLLMFAAN